MYRIVLADDEEYVRELLAKNINQADFDFEVVGTAEHGLQALAMVEQLQPDILITDICMPQLSGLDLIRQMQAVNDSIKTVIISGYDDFSYAKQAMTLGVTDYLLKPFLPSELFEVLHKIGDELKRQNLLLHNIEEMKNQLENQLKLRQEWFLLRLFQGEINADQMLSEARAMRIDLDAGFYSVGLLRFQSAIGEKNRDLKDFLDITKDQYFHHLIATWLVPVNEKQIGVLFCGAYKSREMFYRQIQAGIHLINESMERYYDIKLCCGLGGIYEDHALIAQSYREANQVWKGLLSPSEGVISYEEAVKNRGNSDLKAVQRPKELEENLLTHIQMGRQKQAVETLNNILQYYESVGVQLSEFVSISLVELVFQISGTLMRAGSGSQVWEDENVVEYLKEHFAYGSLQDTKVVLAEYVKKCCEQFMAVNETQGGRIVFRVKELMEQNLGNEDFSLESASAQLFFSHNYVRQIFKQVTGESFMEYFIRRRMETARELLCNPLLKIQDVALRTGYSNQRYFASAFKKYYGMTPTEYRSGQEVN